LRCIIKIAALQRGVGFRATNVGFFTAKAALYMKPISVTSRLAMLTRRIPHRSYLGFVSESAASGVVRCVGFALAPWASYVGLLATEAALDVRVIGVAPQIPVLACCVPH